MPSAAVRFSVEAVFLILVALGAGLARLAPIVIVAVMAVAWVLVALVERAYAREAARAAGDESVKAAEPAAAVEPPRHVSLVEAERAEPPEARTEPQPELEPELEPELAVSERSARAILATGPPPVVESSRAEPEPEHEPEPEPDPQPEPAHEPEPEPVQQREPEPRPEPEPEPEPEPVYSGPPREWSVWDLQRIVRDHPDHPRQEEWSALILSLRDFARADGMLPLDFDDLVRESFGGLLAAEPAPTETAAAP